MFLQGMVELVPSSDTLRKIQVEYGVTGSFKDKPLAEWLRKYNPAEDEYEKVQTHKAYVLKGKSKHQKPVKLFFISQKVGVSHIS